MSLALAKQTNPSLRIYPLSSTFLLLQFPPCESMSDQTSQKWKKAISAALFEGTSSCSHSHRPSRAIDEDDDDDSSFGEELLKKSGENWITISRTVEEISVLVEVKLAVASGLIEAEDVGTQCRSGEEKEENGRKMGESTATKAGWGSEDVEIEKFYGCLRVRGPMDLALTGIAADLTASLKQAQIAVFIISTWNTDWIFVKQRQMEDAASALENDGWVIVR